MKRFQELNHEERKKIKSFYLKTDTGKYVYQNFKKVNIIGIIGLIFSFYLFISAYLDNESFAYYYYAAVLCICSLFFIIAPFIVKYRRLRSFYYQNKKYQIKKQH